MLSSSPFIFLASTTTQPQQRIHLLGHHQSLSHNPLFRLSRQLLWLIICLFSASHALEGKYTCKNSIQFNYTNKGANYWCLFLVLKIILVPPSIATAPQDQTVLSNSIAYFLCKVTGNPKPQIEWRKNGNPINNHRYRITELVDGSILRIVSVKAGRDNDSK